jgi:hypothetical protein
MILPDPMIKLVASVVPILNGRDSGGKAICLGPERTKIHSSLFSHFVEMLHSRLSCQNLTKRMGKTNR